MTLYEIDAAMLACVDQETGEIIDTEALDALQMEREAKVEGVALWIKEEAAMAEALKQEKKNIDARIASHENRRESLTKYLLAATGGQKFETARVKVSFRKTKAVTITDEKALPEQFWRTKTILEPDKVNIRKLLDAGQHVEGATLEERTSTIIK